MRCAVVFLLLAISPAQAEVLFRDEAQGHGYSFESDQKDVVGTASRDQVIELASEWAPCFYGDESLEIADIEFRIEPLRFWLVRFKSVWTEEVFYAVLLPDATIVKPQGEETIFKTPLRHPSQTTDRLRRSSFSRLHPSVKSSLSRRSR
jgi:hypothetical protein